MRVTFDPLLPSFLPSLIFLPPPPSTVYSFSSLPSVLPSLALFRSFFHIPLFQSSRQKFSLLIFFLPFYHPPSSCSPGMSLHSLCVISFIVIYSSFNFQLPFLWLPLFYRGVLLQTAFCLFCLSLLWFQKILELWY